VVKPVELPKPVEQPKPVAPAPQVAIAPPTKPAEPTKMVETAKPAPIQVASAAPTLSLVGMGIDNPRFPKIGDRWDYEFINLSSKQRTPSSVEVTAVSPEGILDTGSSGGGASRSRAHSAGPSLAFVGGPNLQFSPYLLSFGAPKVGETWRNLDAEGAGFCRQGGMSCSYEAKVVGSDKVTTPAGTFDTVKVVLDLNGRTGGGSIFWRQYTYWFAEGAKRVVKASHRTRGGASSAPDYDIELTSYKLN
jgi:hypothetical protein